MLCGLCLPPWLAGASQELLLQLFEHRVELSAAGRWEQRNEGRKRISTRLFPTQMLGTAMAFAQSDWCKSAKVAIDDAGAAFALVWSRGVIEACVSRRSQDGDIMCHRCSPFLALGRHVQHIPISNHGDVVDHVAQVIQYRRRWDLERFRRGGQQLRKCGREPNLKASGAADAANGNSRHSETFWFCDTCGSLTHERSCRQGSSEAAFGVWGRRHADPHDC
mmetsp:Transcript_23532/g.53541  ORF Transcript_23532/g.53541 Transcript_23532/m.53541 type:complete len:221 (+) Transcript_23532:104-766(+)